MIIFSALQQKMHLSGDAFIKIWIFGWLEVKYLIVEYLNNLG